MDQPTYMRSGEVAKLFHVSRRTIWDWVKAGKLPTIPSMSNHARFDREAIERMARGEAA